MQRITLCLLTILIPKLVAASNQAPYCDTFRKQAFESTSKALANKKKQIDRLEGQSQLRNESAKKLLSLLYPIAAKDSISRFKQCIDAYSHAFIDTTFCTRIAHLLPQPLAISNDGMKIALDAALQSTYTKDSIAIDSAYNAEVARDTTRILSKAIGCVEAPLRQSSHYQVSGKGLLSKTQEGTGTGDLSIGFDYWNTPDTKKSFLEWGIKLIVSGVSNITTEFPSKILNPDDNGVSLNGYWSHYKRNQFDLDALNFHPGDSLGITPGFWTEYHVSPYQWRKDDTVDNALIMSGDLAISLRMFDVPEAYANSGMERFSVTSNIGIAGRLIGGDVGQDTTAIRRYIGVHQSMWLGEFIGFRIRYNEFAFTTNWYNFDMFRFIGPVKTMNARTKGITGGQLVAKVEISSAFWKH